MDISNFADVLWGSSGRNTHCGHCLQPQFEIQKDLGALELLRNPQVPGAATPIPTRIDSRPF